MMFSAKDLVLKEKLARKLVDQYVGLYIIEKVVSTNVVKLRLPISIKIFLFMNVSWVVRYKEPVKR